MIFGKLLNGRLTDIQYAPAARTWADGSTDVPLNSIPTFTGPYTYDAVNKVATAAIRTTAEKFSGLLHFPFAILASPTVLAALTVQEKAQVQALIDNFAASAIAALRGN